MLTPIMSNIYDNNQYYYANPIYPTQQFQQPYYSCPINNITMQPVSPEAYNPYLTVPPKTEVTNPIYYRPDDQESAPNSKQARSASKQKRQNITMTSEEQKILKERAAAAKMTVSGFVVKYCVYGQDSSGCDRAADLAQHLAAMSNAINVLEDGEVKKILEKEILGIWRILR